MNRTETYDPRWSKLGQPLAASAVPTTGSRERQYSLVKILAIWAAAVLPMSILGWIVAPLLESHIDLGVGEANNPAFMRAVMLTFGLIWQFVLCMTIVWRDEGSLSLSAVRRRCWLNRPRDPKTGELRGKLFLWLIPLFFLLALIQIAPIADLWESVFPFLGEPDKYSFQAIMASADRKAALEGAWQVLGLFIVLGLFNTVLGEELLFRGILLPRMEGVFGKGDWVANGILFGLYHLHQPWSIVGSIFEGVFCLSFSSRRFRSVWFGIALHSAQTVFFIFAALGLVLGLA